MILVTPFSFCEEYKDPLTAWMNFDLHTCKNIGTHYEIIDWTFICKYVQHLIRLESRWAPDSDRKQKLNICLYISCRN